MKNCRAASLGGLCLSVLMLIGLSSPSQAVPTLVVSGGILQGATGVTVNGALYDVEFTIGTCAQLFSGCDEPSDFAFSTEQTAQDAALALLAEVFLDGPDGAFDSDPGLTNGCGGATVECLAITPYAGISRTYNARAARNTPGTDSAVAFSGGMNGQDTIFNPSFTWAVFSGSALDPEPDMIPEPTMLLVFAAGLSGLVGFRRRTAEATVLPERITSGRA